MSNLPKLWLYYDELWSNFSLFPFFSTHFANYFMLYCIQWNTIHPTQQHFVLCTTLYRFLIALCTSLIWLLNSIAQNIKIGVGNMICRKIDLYLSVIVSFQRIFGSLECSPEMKQKWKWLIRGNSRNWLKLSSLATNLMADL